MPYDATKPANGAPILSAELRDQFAGLKELIDDKVPLPDLDNYMLGFCAGRVPPDFPSLNLTVSNPPTQLQMQTIANKLDELILLLRRG